MWTCLFVAVLVNFRGVTAELTGENKDTIFWNTNYISGVAQKTRVSNVNFTESSFLVRCTKNHFSDFGKHTGVIELYAVDSKVSYPSAVWRTLRNDPIEDSRMEITCIDYSFCLSKEADKNLHWCDNDFSMVISKDNISFLCGDTLSPTFERYSDLDRSINVNKIQDIRQTFDLEITDFSEACTSRIKRLHSDWKEMTEDNLVLPIDLSSHDLVVNWLPDKNEDVLNITLTEDDRTFVVSVTRKSGKFVVSLTSPETCQVNIPIVNVLENAAVEITLALLATNLIVSVIGASSTLQMCGAIQAPELRITDSTARNTSIISNVNFKTTGIETRCSSGERVDGSGVCQKCQPGYYSTTGSDCERCPTHHYSSTPGSSECQLCEDGQVDVSYSTCLKRNETAGDNGAINTSRNFIYNLLIYCVLYIMNVL